MRNRFPSASSNSFSEQLGFWQYPAEEANNLRWVCAFGEAFPLALATITFLLYYQSFSKQYQLVRYKLNATFPNNLSLK
jgi:hypothetical protein